MVKHSAFLPHKTDRETSVFRHGVEPQHSLWRIAASISGERKVHAAGVILAGQVRQQLLEVVASEPPERHAALRDWPWNDVDPEMEKARHKEIALALARDAILVVAPIS